MKRSLLLVLCLVSLSLKGQILDELWKKYNLGDLEYVLEKGLPLIKAHPNNLDLNLLIGRSFADNNQFKEAIPYLDFVNQNDVNQTWRQAWSLAYLGISYFGSSNYELSNKCLRESIILNKTENVSKKAKSLMLLFGFDKVYREFETRETEHLIFHFHPKAVELIKDLEKYINDREIAFGVINQYFIGVVPKKIDFFVWDSRETMSEVLHTNIGFANPDLCIVHCCYDQTKGHEITHVVSNYIDKIKNKSFINEGTAVVFDQTDRDRISVARDAIKVKGLVSLSIKDMWNPKTADLEILYPVSGAFVEFLINKEGKEKFFQLFKNQTYENAKVVYGEAFDSLILEFEQLLFKS